MSVPIIVVGSIDAASRDRVSFRLLLDRPDALLVRHEILPDEDGEGGSVRRVVSDWSGLLVDEWTHLSHSCLNCAARSDIIPTLSEALSRSPGAIILATPLTAVTFPIVWEVREALRDGRLRDAHIARVLAAFDSVTFAQDAFSDESVTAREGALSAGDGRSVGEATCHLAEVADAICLTDAPLPAQARLVRHLVPADVALTSLEEDLLSLWEGEHDIEACRARIDPARWAVSGETDAHDVWTLVLDADRPLHPERFASGVEALGGGLVRTRGCFHLASRPMSLGVWDGAGGQVYIGDGGVWDVPPRTRIVATGRRPEDRDRVIRAFTAMLLTDLEMKHPVRWTDDLDPWMGEYPETA